MASTNIWNRRIAALALGIGLAMSAVIGPCWWSIVRYHDPVCSAYKPDFISLYTGASLMWSDRASLYDLETQRLIQEPIDPSRGSWVLPFFYPPFFAGMLVPLAWLPFSLAFITMSAVNLGCLTAAIALLRSKLQLSQPQMTWLVLSTFCNFGVHYAFLEAQTSFLVLLLTTGFVLSAQANKSSGSGLWASLLCFKPQLIVGPLLVLLAWRRWREIGSIGIIATTMGILSFLAVGKDGIQAYVALTRLAAAGDAVLHIQPEGMQNLRALAIFFFTSSWEDGIYWGATLLLIGFIVLRSIEPARLDQEVHLRWIVILLASILIAPHFHIHDLTLLIIPTAFLLKLGGNFPRPQVVFVLVLIGTIPLINTVARQSLPPLFPILALILILAERLNRTAFLKFVRPE